MAQGEGSRGGKIIRHTKSGNAVYAASTKVIKGAAKDAVSAGASTYAFGRIFKHTHSESVSFGLRGAAVFGAAGLAIRGASALNRARKKRKS